jgi:hypothetical protein
MPRPRYIITQYDFHAARAYLIRKGFARNPGRGVESIDNPDQLQQWCDDYLLPAQWKSLRSTILQERKRGRDEAKNRKPSNITVSPRTLSELHKIQHKLADKHKITIDQIIHAMALKYSHKSAAQILRELEIQNEFDL